MTNDNADPAASRREKLGRLREKGINPFPNRFDATHRLGALAGEFSALTDAESPNEVAVCGRLMTWRDHGKTAFVHIEDSTGRIQTYLRHDKLGDAAWSMLANLDIGDFIGVKGRMFRTRTGELTVRADSLTLLAKSLRPPPEKWHGLKDVDIRYRNRHIDLLSNRNVRGLFSLRAKALGEMRAFLDKRGFTEVETPVLQPLYGGADATPFTTHYESLDADFYLRISDELYLKRLLVGGMDRVYEFAKDFRNEGLDRQHLPEFTMLELYEAYSDYRGMMGLAEEMLRHTVTSLNAERNALTGLRDRPGTLTYQGKLLDFNQPWPRVEFVPSLAKALGFDPLSADDAALRSAAAKCGVPDHQKLTRARLIDKLFTSLVQDRMDDLAFIIDHPIELSPLCKAHDDNPRLAERFEPVIAGTEVGNAFSELNDPDEQRKRFLSQLEMRKQGDREAHVLDEEFVSALECGMPPAGGLGVGIDRLVMVLADVTGIREVVLFPQLRAGESGR